jgi:Ca-activated chloride channel homolog
VIAALRYLAAALLLALAGPTLADPRPIVLIIDSSGSMAADLDGRPRLDVAREVIAAEVGAWVAGAPLGVVAYGHRRAGDCADIETLLPVGMQQEGDLADTLGQLRARGKTPLSAAMVQAAGLLPDGGSIILVSDGLETCDADPCAVAQSLVEATVDLQIFVIGFGMTSPELAALQCIADNGKGQLLSANSAESLGATLAALGDTAAAPKPDPAPVVEPAPAAPAPEPPPPLPPPVPMPVPVAFEALTAAGLVPAPVSWTVTTADGQPVYQGAGRSIALDLLPGAYGIRIAGNNVTGDALLQVTGPSSAVQPVPISAGQLVAHLVAGDGLSLAEADLGGDILWTVTPLDGQAPVKAITGLDPSAVLAPGGYRVDAALGARMATAAVVVKDGVTSDVTLSLALGRLDLELVTDAAAGPVESGDGLEWLVAPVAGGETVSAAATARPSLILPAGSYDVTARLDGATVSGRAEVQDGTSTLLTLNNAAGIVTLEGALGPGAEPFSDWRFATWTVTPVGGQGVEPALTDHPEARPVLKLAPGEWEAVLISGGVTATRRFTVQPAVEQTVRIDHQAAMLTLTGRMSAEADPFTDWRDVTWTVRSADGAVTPLDSSPELSPVLILPAGDWQVLLVSGAARLDQTVTLAAGAVVTVDAALNAGRVAFALVGADTAELTISALDANGQPVTPPVATGPAAPRFQTVVPAGQYIVEATTPDGRFGSLPFEITPGSDHRLDLPVP